MNKKKIKEYIPDAIQYLNKEFNNDKIPKEYNGYISSFGAGLVQSGLIPTVAFFENENSSANEKPKKITKIILRLITEDKKGDKLLNYILEKGQDEILEKEIKYAAIALKHALRTFELSERGDSGKNE